MHQTWGYYKILNTVYQAPVVLAGACSVYHGRFPAPGLNEISRSIE
jgi:hypothetical protein